MVQSTAATVAGYLAELAPDVRAELEPVLAMVRAAMPEGYVETVNWGMICWEIPLARYPKTYNGQPLGYVALAAQKRHLSLYLMAAYMRPDGDAHVRALFAEAGKKLDMGKSCVRFRRAADLPLEGLAVLIRGTSVADYVAAYEAARAQPRTRAKGKDRTP